MFVEVPTSVGGQPSAEITDARSRGPKWSVLRSNLTPLLYLLPAVALLVVWVYKPLAETVGLSFYQWNMIPTTPKVPVGLENYATVLSLPELHQALWNTVLYIATFMVLSLLLPVGIALLCGQVTGRWRTFYQALIFVPFLVTPVASSAIWRWMFNPEGGTIPRIAASLGFEMGNIFRDPKLALLGVVVVVGWQMLGFGVLVISAGMAGINPDYSSAASLDGASRSMITRRITLPLLSPTLVFLALMTILLGAQWAYPVIDVLTQGGPSGATTNIYYLLYEFGFRNFDAGLAAAAGTLFFLGFAVIAFVFVRVSDRLSFYDN
ncbi:sugar ABC transporter permease [Rhodococcus sp. IEGM 1379]|uniref:carbohydrate ABC transporter permease n=1 Tax=Rhodococcus sp. IEGM 1379 TaxID=3047086 RepID=UPI0024B6710C|nr:sugar ABC transporter permease [Rhodococcus sp. IEGM 1379]MDI9918291.1 sugar ABC transporter permease [Rhodococcus sp. IEGM 1379]